MPENKPNEKPAAAPPSSGVSAEGSARNPARSGPTPPDKEQAQLDKEAADAQAKVEAEAKRLAELEADAQKAEERADDHGEPRAARCPNCRERLERYTGANPHKAGTHWCPNCGRMKLR